MPIMSGIDATQEIRRMQALGVLSRHLPILGVSANVRGAKGKSPLHKETNVHLKCQFYVQCKR